MNEENFLKAKETLSYLGNEKFDVEGMYRAAVFAHKFSDSYEEFNKGLEILKRLQEKLGFEKIEVYDVRFSVNIEKLCDRLKHSFGAYNSWSSEDAIGEKEIEKIEKSIDIEGIVNDFVEIGIIKEVEGEKRYYWPQNETFTPNVSVELVKDYGYTPEVLTEKSS